MSARPIVVVLGVHRSGTSLAARLLEALGIRLGGPLLPGHRDNPEGFWEHQGIITATRRLEEALGVNPFRGTRMAPPEGAWWTEEACREPFEQLRALLTEECAGDGVFGFKDPRSLLLLPMWKALFAALDLAPRYVLALRHPGATARSMQARAGIRPRHGQLLWVEHWRYGLRHLSTAPHAVVSFERWFEAPAAQLATLAAGLGIADARRAEVEARLAELVRPGRVHHSAGAEDPLLPQAQTLYASLSRADAASWEALRAEAAGLAEQALARDVFEGVAARAAASERRLQEARAEVEALQARVRTLASGADASRFEDIYAVEPRPAAASRVEHPDLTAFIRRVDRPGRTLRVCIAAEDIVGPIRNGGIGTTYFHLARMLAEAGHDVTIAYLRGGYCENRSIGHWVDWYRRLGVRFVPLDPDDVPVECAAPRWTRPMIGLYEFLRRERFELVHCSEWRGSAFVCLLAKRQGLAFADTHFCIKASSPWLWNREHGYHLLERLSDLPKMHAERRSIELADRVIGGSQYLLRWMLEHGYRLPRDCHVQPNVVVPHDLGELSRRRRPFVGKRMPVEEIVFFGRLEYRKGLDIFFDALERLAAEGVELPPVSLMGKYGERMPSFPSQPDMTTPDYIKFRARGLPCSLTVRNQLGNEKALRYLLSGARLAVMPSRIENSTLCVYETAYYGIPCIASDRGGTAELLQRGHRAHVLTEPHPVALAGKLREALKKGGFVPKASFDNDHNLGVWLRFHSALGGFLDGAAPAPSRERPRLSLCLVFDGDLALLRHQVESLGERLDGRSLELRLVIERGQLGEVVAQAGLMGKLRGGQAVALEASGQGAQTCQNLAAARAAGEVLVFLAPGAVLLPAGVEAIRSAAAASPAGVFGGFYERAATLEDARRGARVRCAVFAGDHSSAFFDAGQHSPLLAVRREVFARLGGFREDHQIPGALGELCNLARLRNVEVETIPACLAWTLEEHAGRGFAYEDARLFRTLRPFFEQAPECLKRVLLAAPARGSGPTPGGQFGISSGQIRAVETQAQRVATEAGSIPTLRDFGEKVYFQQLKMFKRLLELEVQAFGAVTRTLKSLRDP